MINKNSEPKLKKRPSTALIIVFIILFWPVGLMFLYRRLTYDANKPLNNNNVLRYFGIGIIFFGLIFCSFSPTAKFETGESAVLPYLVISLSIIACGIIIIKNANKSKIKNLQNQEKTKFQKNQLTSVPYDKITEQTQIYSDKNFENILLKIKDPKMYEIVKKIDVTCKHIYAHVLLYPNERSKIRQFEQYYIPKTIELIESYIQLDNGEINTDDVNKTKIKFENFLVDVQVAFLNQLNFLYKDDTLNMSIDIDIFKSFLKQDALIDSDNILKVEREVRMGLFDGMSEKELKKAMGADFVTRKLSAGGSVPASDLFEIIDKETGVRYLFFSYIGHAGGLTPRLNRDGTIMTIDMEELKKVYNAEYNIQ